MAYVRQSNLLDDNEELTGTSSINTSLNSGNSAPNNASDPNSVPNPVVQQGTGFTNLQRYLSANTQGAQNLGNQIEQKFNETRANAMSGLVPAAQKFEQEVQKSASTFNPNASDEELGAFANKQYSGPTEFTPDAATQKNLYDASQKADLAKTVEGRTEILREQLNKNFHRTGQGAMNLNQFLVQNSPDVMARINQAAGNLRGVGDQYGTFTKGLTDQARAAQENMSGMRNLALSTLDARAKSRAQAAQDAANAKIQADLKAQQDAYAAQQQQAAAAAQAAQAAQARQYAAQQEELQRQLAELAAQQRAAAEAERARQAAAQTPAPIVRENAPNVPNESKPINPFVPPIQKAVDVVKSIAKPGPSSPGWMVPVRTETVTRISGDNDWQEQVSFDRYGNEVPVPQSQVGGNWWEQGPTGGA